MNKGFFLSFIYSGSSFYSCFFSKGREFHRAFGRPFIAKQYAPLFEHLCSVKYNFQHGDDRHGKEHPRNPGNASTNNYPENGHQGIDLDL